MFGWTNIENLKVRIFKGAITSTLFVLFQKKKLKESDEDVAKAPILYDCFYPFMLQ